MMKNKFSRFMGILCQPSIAVDLGTANTRIFCPEFGQIKEKPSLIRLTNDKRKKHVTDEYLSYLNSKMSFMPLRGGVIVDINNAIKLLRPLLKETRQGFRLPVSLASAPTDASDKEREFLAKAILNAGASHVAIIPEVWAAAIGAGMDITSPHAQVLIDIGEGVTDLAVIRDGRLIYTSAVRTACSDLQKAVRSAIVSRHKVYISDDEAERLTHIISSIAQEQLFNHKLITVIGNDILKGDKVTINVKEQDIINALEPVINKILKMIELNLRKLSMSISSEILESGICLSGGGACISGMNRLIALRTKLDVRIAPDPIHAVINGEIETLKFWQGHKNWWENIVWPRLLS
ncbi:MAG: rod shape-determining protein [Deltaproteobacteria bacterium]|nr:rod shape-determining protein [Deltaproteobacteria bacterium]